MALTSTDVQQLYVAYYGRPADPAGLAYWQGQTLEAAMAGFSASPEFTNQYAGMTTTQTVAQVYQNLLGRVADEGGLQYWANEIAAQRETIGSLVMSMLQNALGRDASTIEMRIWFSEAFTVALDGVAEIAGFYSGQDAAQAVRDAMSSLVAAFAGDIYTLMAALLDDALALIQNMANAGNDMSMYTLTSSIDTLYSSGNDEVMVELTGVTPLGTADFALV